MTLTGRIGVRTGWRGRVVLRVEVRAASTSGNWRTRWRDATEDDLCRLGWFDRALRKGQPPTAAK